MPPEEKARTEGILKKRYLKVTKIILLLAIFYSIWTAFNIISVYFLGFGNKWAILTMDMWLLSCIGLLSIFIIFEVLFVLHFLMVKKKRVESEKPKPVLFKGKSLHTFTIPINCKGGIFSKTHIKIDENMVLNIKYQMISPNDLWQSKE